MVRIMSWIALLSSLVISPVVAGEWVMRPAESSISIVAEQQGAEFTGQFKEFTADITFDPADLANASVVVVINTGSFDSESKDRDSAVRGSDWFRVKKFPDARFVAKSFVDLGEGKYEVVADLSIREATQEVVLPMVLVIEGDVATMSGTLNMDRTQYGVGQGQWETTDWVGRDVKVTVAVVADRQP